MILFGIDLFVCRYALDVNVERAEDVLMHKRLLHLAHDPNNRPAIEVRLVQVSVDLLAIKLNITEKFNLFSSITCIVG